MASNSYGFDFLKSEHTLNSNIDPYSRNNASQQDVNNIDGSATANSNSLLLMDDESFRQREMLAMNKPALEKQYDILAFLQKHTRGNSITNRFGGSVSLPPNIIHRATGIDIQNDSQVQEMLQNNPKVHIEYIPDPENPNLLMVPHYMYQAKYPNIVDRASLIAQINRMGDTGIPMIRDLYDCYANIEHDILSCICSGDIIAIANNDDRDKILFPRGDLFLTELDGIVTIPDDPKIDTNASSVASSNTGLEGKTSLNKSDPKSKDNTNAFNDATSKVLSDESKKPNDLLLGSTKNDTENKNIDSAGVAATNGKAKSANITNMDDPSSKLDKTTINNLQKDIYFVNTDIDPRKQIRRGEAIQIGGQWFRISSAIKAGVPLSEQPIRAQAPLSVVSHQDLSSRNQVDGYIRLLSSTQIPLDDALNDMAQHNLRTAKTTRETLSKLAQCISGGNNTSSNSSGSIFGGTTNRHNSQSISGIIAQLIGSHAHAANPTKLATSLATTMQHQYHHTQQSGFNQNQRKRPHATSAVVSTTSSNTQTTTNTMSRPGPTTSIGSMNQIKMAIEKAASDPSLALYNHARRHGCSKDIRDMYFATRKHVPESDHDLQRTLVEYKLLEPNEIMRRPRLMNIKALGSGGMNGNKSNLDNDGKPKKRRYYERKNQRMTNTHLEGTEIGALLALAAEKQKQGKSVGDGGM